MSRKAIFRYRRSSQNLRWYFTLEAENGEIVALSQGYKSKQGCLKGIASIQRIAREAILIEG